MRRRMLAFALLFLGVIPMLVAQGKGRGRGHDKDDSPKGNSGKGQTVMVFRTEDRNAITSYYRAQPGGLPPGLEKKLVPFPPELESRLAPCPPEVTRGMIGGIAVMWSRQTGLVVDAAV